MKRMLALLVLVGATAGCNEMDQPGAAQQSPRPEVQFQYADQRLTVSKLGDNDYGRWRLVELKYGGKKHVFLQHYDGNNQGLVKVGEYNLQAEIQ